MEKKTTKKAVAKKTAETPVNEKPTYEQLENYAKQLSIQAQRMAKQINDYQAILDSKRMDYLFKVIENPISFEEDFVNECAKEIAMALTVQEEE